MTPRSHRLRARFALGAALAVVLAAASCGSEPAASEAPLELGTGEWRFEPLTDGQEVWLVAGSQGGYHVWASFLSEGLSPDGVTLDIDTQLADESRAPETSHVTVDMAASETGGVELLGWPARIWKPGCVMDKLMRLTATITDQSGVRASDERTLLVRWAPPPGADTTCE